MFTSTTCPSDNEMTGPNYAYLVYTSPEGTLVRYTAFDEVTTDPDGTDNFNEFVGPWVVYDISNFTSSGRECVGVTWNSNKYVFYRLFSKSNIFM
jgi:hypothetical protein